MSCHRLGANLRVRQLDRQLSDLVCAFGSIEICRFAAEESAQCRSGFGCGRRESSRSRLPSQSLTKRFTLQAPDPAASTDSHQESPVSPEVGTSPFQDPAMDGLKSDCKRLQIEIQDLWPKHLSEL